MVGFEGVMENVAPVVFESHVAGLAVAQAGSVVGGATIVSCWDGDVAE
jgi:hypothetical protein